MKAVHIKEFGPAENLEIIETDIPEPAADEVLIKIHAAGINRPDIVQRNGFYPPPPGASDILGLECAGEITAVGPDVKRWNVGDKVCALLTGGGYAEYAVAHEGCCLPIPKGLDYVEAAAIPETFFTVWANLCTTFLLCFGETILIHGGTSGIGTAAIQIAKLRGATVITTSGSDEKCRQAKELGADHTSNYKTEDFVEKVLSITNNEGVNVILDMVAGDYVGRNLKALEYDGRLIIIAVQGGANVNFNILPVLTKRLEIIGSTLRPRCNAFKAEIAEDLERDVWPLLKRDTWSLLKKDKIRPVIDKTFPLDQVIEAHKYLESGNHFGKVMLKVV